MVEKEMQEEIVDPRFHTMPYWEQIRTFGYAWISEQQRIFDKVSGEAEQ